MNILVPWPEFATGNWLDIIRGAHRINPVVDLEADIAAVVRAAAASTRLDWQTASFDPAEIEVADSGFVTLKRSTTGLSLFSQTASTDSKFYAFRTKTTDDKGELFLDFWPDPATFTVPMRLHSIALKMARDATTFVTVSIQVYEIDKNWQRFPLGDPVSVIGTPLVTPTVFTFDLAGRNITLTPGRVRALTGPGRDNSGALRNVNVDADGNSHLDVPRGFSIGISLSGGHHPEGFFLSYASGQAVFTTTDFWRVATDRNHGPYLPGVSPFPPTDTSHSADPFLSFGAVPGFGAKNVSNGSWGLSMAVTEEDRAQSDGAWAWRQPYHDVKIVTFAASGDITKVLDMGGVPTNPVEIRLQDVVPKGTSITYELRGSTDNFGASDVLVTGNAKDGVVFTGAALFRYYKLIATLTAGAAGGNNLASPGLQSWQMVERVVFGTERYMKDFDATATVDPIDGKVEVSELRLPMLRVTPDARDLATRIASEYAPSQIEARVYAKNRVKGTRLFLNSYRLETRNPGEHEEEFTFLSGLDRLKVVIPPKLEKFTLTGLTVTGTPSYSGGKVTMNFSGGTLTASPAHIGQRVYFRTGVLAGAVPEGTGANRTMIVSAHGTGSVTFPTADAGDIPSAGDVFEIHSDTFERREVAYHGQDFANIYEDVLAIQAQVPASLRGRLPTPTSRLGTNRLTSDGRVALEVLQELALHCGGVITWDEGQIAYADIFGPKDVAAVWTEDHYSSLETPTGADRRTPSLVVPYNFDFTTGKFLAEAALDDVNALTSHGRANLFDVTRLPDELCKWNDKDEAEHLGDRFLRVGATGVRIWKVRTVFMWPWLKIGDAVTIMTNQYTDRAARFDGAGLVDSGRPVRGRLAAVGVIVGKNLWGTEWAVLVRSLDEVFSVVVGTGDLQPKFPNPTYSVVRTASAIVVSWVYPQGDTTTYIRVWTKTFTADPGALETVELAAGATEVTPRFDRDDGRLSVSVAVDATNDWAAITLIAYDQNNRRNIVTFVRERDAGASPPGAPGTPTQQAVTSTTATVRVPNNVSAVAGWKTHLLRGGMKVQQATLTSTDITNGYREFVETGLSPATTYSYTGTHENANGEGAASAALSVTTSGGGTLPTPSIMKDTTFEGESFDPPPARNHTITVTLGANTPAATTQVYEEKINAGAFAEIYRGPELVKTFNAGTLGDGDVYTYRVKVVKAGWTDSAYSNVT
jgi:hypothetical protein